MSDSDIGLDDYNSGNASIGTHYSNFMSNLIPEKRVNKNGVAVTKHVRTNQSSAASASFPSPSPGANTARPATPLIDEAIVLFRNRPVRGFTLDDVAPEALEKLEALLKEESEMKPSSSSVCNGIGTALGQITLEECVEYMHNIAVFAPIITGLKDNTVSVSTYVTGLKQYPEEVLWPNMDYLKDAPESSIERAKSLVDFTLKASRRTVVSDAIVYDSFMELWDSEGGVTDVYIKLNDDELATYIMDHPEHGDAILDMVEREGGTLPVKLMADRLNHEVSSLRDGVL